LQRGDCRHWNGCGLLEGDVGRLQDNATICPGAQIFGHGSVFPPEDLVARLELRDVFPNHLDCARVIKTETRLLRFA
jgi:hypothetical protein